MNSSNQNTPKIVGALAVAIVIGIGGYLFLPHDGLSNLPSTTSSTTNTSLVTAATTPSTQASSSASSYKDGVYTVTASYRVPGGGRNDLRVTLTVKNDTVAAVNTVNTDSESQSQYYTDSFDVNLSSSVVSTPLKNAFVSRVGGASLTSNAFDSALQTIMNDAKA